MRFFLILFSTIHETYSKMKRSTSNVPNVDSEVVQTGCSVCASCWLPATPAEATKHGELLATGTAGKSEGLSRQGHRMKAYS